MGSAAVEVVKLTAASTEAGQKLGPHSVEKVFVTFEAPMAKECFHLNTKISIL